MKRFLPIESFIAALSFGVVACGSSTAEPAPTEPADASAPSDAASADASRSYDAPQALTVSTDRPHDVRIAWTAPRNADGLTGYRVLRDGVAIVELAASRTAHDDATAAAATLRAPTVTATNGTSESVKLTWAPAGADGAPAVYTYAVIALYDRSASAPSEARGGRSGAISGYEVTVDDGATWAALPGLATTYEDKSAPRVPITFPTATVTPDDPRSLVRLELLSHPTAGTAAAVTYRIRARAQDRIGAPSLPAVGRRGAGRLDALAIQWQRSAGATDAAYTDIPGVTGRVWVDPTAPKDTRFFRARADAPWAEGTSAAAPGRAAAWKEVSVIPRHTCGIRERDDKVECWGDVGLPAPPPDELYGMTGSHNRCAIRRSDDRVVCWGVFGRDEIDRTPTADAFVAVSAAFGVTCGIRKSDRKAVCWGQTQATLFESDNAFVTLGSNTSEFCGTRISDGHIFCWSVSRFGNSPEVEVGVDNYRSVAVPGPGVACGIRASDGHIDCWSRNGFPMPVFPPVGFRALSQGAHCGLVEPKGRLECWGAYHRPIGSDHDFIAVSSTEAHGCGIESGTGKMVCWGSNTDGEAPTVPLGHAFKSVSFNSGATGCGLLDEDGKLVCWGRDSYSVQNVPLVPVTGPFKALSAGGYLTCALRALDGRMECFFGSAGQGLPTITTGSYTAVAALHTSVCGIRAADQRVECFNGEADSPSLETVQSFASGAGHICAVLPNGKPKCWPGNSGWANPPEASASTFRSLAVGQNLKCGIRASDGSVECWGNHLNTGQIPNMPPGPFKSIAIGDYAYYGCGIRASDDRAECWGSGTWPVNGLLMAPSLDPFKSLAAVGDTMCGIRLSDSKMFCWGARRDGAVPRP